MCSRRFRPVVVAVVDAVVALGIDRGLASRVWGGAGIGELSLLLFPCYWFCVGWFCFLNYTRCWVSLMALRFGQRSSLVRCKNCLKRVGTRRRWTKSCFQLLYSTRIEFHWETFTRFKVAHHTRPCAVAYALINTNYDCVTFSSVFLSPR